MNNIKYLCLPLFKLHDLNMPGIIIDDKLDNIPVDDIKYIHPDTKKQYNFINYNKLLTKIFEKYNVLNESNKINVPFNILNKTIKIFYPIEFDVSKYNIFFETANKKIINFSSYNSLSKYTPFEKLKRIYLDLKHVDDFDEITMIIFKQQITQRPNFENYNFDTYNFNLYANTINFYMQVNNKFKIYKHECLSEITKLLQFVLTKQQINLSEIFESEDEKIKLKINEFINTYHNKLNFIHTVNLTVLDLIFICDTLSKKIPYIYELYNFIKSQIQQNTDFNALYYFPTLFFGSSPYNYNLYLDYNEKDKILIDHLDEFNVKSEDNKWMYGEQLKINNNSQLTNIVDFFITPQKNKFQIILKDMILNNEILSKYKLVSKNSVYKKYNIVSINNIINDMENLIGDTLNEFN